MTEDRTAASRPRFLRTTLSQLLVAMIATPTVYLIVGAVDARSFLSGAACAIGPQLFFTLRLERAAKHSADRAARLGMAAEAGKFVLSAVCFALVFGLLKAPRPAMVFAGFGLMWCVQLLEAVRLARQPQGR